MAYVAGYEILSQSLIALAYSDDDDSFLCFGLLIMCVETCMRREEGARLVRFNISHLILFGLISALQLS